MSHSAENLKESSKLAKGFVSNKRRGGFDENKYEKSHKVQKRRSLKFTEKKILKQKNNHSEKPHNAENCIRGSCGLF